MVQQVKAIVSDIHDLPPTVPVTSSIMHVFGSVEPLPKTSKDFDAEIEEAMQDAAGLRVWPSGRRGIALIL